ncbi:MAG TPA: dTDP-4-amino-4,6-dideoxygalactose transaminase [Ktedonobacterales bacterium]|nr:dTDP-4-amino-4,6-dideoxygalactose transaminase [Ktedonobacterales bacterium]
MAIPFNRPYVAGKELEYIAEACASGHLSGNGQFTWRAQAWLEEYSGSAKALLTHSCTAALEMAAILADIGPGDEVIMPSYTFVSTANAVVLRGGVPVFVDIRPDTLNLDETLIEAAITSRTRAIMVVHYAGVSCAMDEISAIAARHGLLVIEDDAQGIMASYRGRPLGSLGNLAAISFHETKNVISGEGGALFVNDPRLVERAEIIWEKGTNRTKFFRGQVDKYTWVDIGSSYLPSELNAAFLYAQLESIESIMRERLALWHCYHDAFAPLEAQGLLRRPVVPPECTHNGHIYYIRVADLATRTRVLDDLKAAGVGAVFHYVPLHTTVPGTTLCRAHGELPVTLAVSDTLVRMPLWVGMPEAVVEQAVGIAARTVGTTSPATISAAARGRA